MRIVHGSDWHGAPRKVPEADLYVFTGDMLDNYPVMEVDSSLRWWRIDRNVEYLSQREAIAKFLTEGGMRPFLGSPDAPIVCVRGNHDFVDIAPLFQGCNLVHEFKANELVEVLGIKVTGHRGIPYIAGSWQDEVSKGDLKFRMREMPNAHVYVTHYPPAGVLDCDNDLTYPESYGLESMADNLLYRGGRSLHCFGHIHESGGMTKTLGDVTFSNAATTFNVIDIELQ